jgi:hypothetical protein
MGGYLEWGHWKQGKNNLLLFFYHVNHAEVVPLEVDLESTPG